MGSHDRLLSPRPRTAQRSAAGISLPSFPADRMAIPGWIPPWARTAREPMKVGENQKVAQNVVSSTNVSFRGSW